MKTRAIQGRYIPVTLELLPGKFAEDHEIICVVVLGVSPVSPVGVIAPFSARFRCNSFQKGAESHWGPMKSPILWSIVKLMAFYGSKSSISKIKMDLTDDLLLKMKWVHWCPMPSWRAQVLGDGCGFVWKSGTWWYPKKWWFIMIIEWPFGVRYTLQFQIDSKKPSNNTWKKHGTFPSYS